MIVLSIITAGTFNLLIYTDKDLETPAAWEESKPFLIGNSEEVKLRSFTTSIHKVEAMVSYRIQDDWKESIDQWRSG